MRGLEVTEHHGNFPHPWARQQQEEILTLITHKTSKINGLEGKSPPTPIPLCLGWEELTRSLSLSPGSMGPFRPKSCMANGDTSSTPSLQESAQRQTASGNKLSYPDDHLMAVSGSKEWYFIKWSRNSGQCLLFWFC